MEDEDLSKHQTQYSREDFLREHEDKNSFPIPPLSSFVQNLNSEVAGTTYYSRLPIWNNNWCWFLFFFFGLLKVRDYSPPLLVIKSVWQDSSEVLWPSGHVAAAQAVLQTGLLAVMCYQAGDFKGLLQAHLRYPLGLTLSPKVRYQMADNTKSKLIRSPGSSAKGCCNLSGRKQVTSFSFLLLLLIILRSHQFGAQLFVWGF